MAIAAVFSSKRVKAVEKSVESVENNLNSPAHPADQKAVKSRFPQVICGFCGNVCRYFPRIFTSFHRILYRYHIFSTVFPTAGRSSIIFHRTARRNAPWKTHPTRKTCQSQYFLSRLRSCMASAMCIAPIDSLDSRSAIVRATRRIRSYPRAESLSFS